MHTTQVRGTNIRDEISIGISYPPRFCCMVISKSAPAWRLRCLFPEPRPLRDAPDRGGEMTVSIGPTVRRRRLGTELRRLREAHSIKLEEGAHQVGVPDRDAGDVRRR